jgi:hypothetical protein
MGVFAAAAMTSSYFLAGQIGLVGAPSAEQTISNTNPSQPPAPRLVPQASTPALRHPVRVIPIERPETETTGAPPAEAASSASQEPKALPEQPRCDRHACDRAYRSFDPASCTYQPRTGPRRLCRK